MQTLAVEMNGAIVIRIEAREAQSLRDELADSPSGSDAHTLQRHLAMVHGEAKPVHANRMRCLDPHCGPCSFDRAIPKETQR